MAAKAGKKGEERLLVVLNSMAGDGLSLPPDDAHNIEALIDDYFDGSELGEEVRLLSAFFELHHTRLK